MTHITERIELHQIPMSQRKRVGMLCQRHMESRHNPGTVESLRALLREHIDNHQNGDTRALRWMLARMVADPMAERNCRQYICQLLYD